MVFKRLRVVCLMLPWLGVRAKTFQISVAGETYGPKQTKANVGDTIQVLFTVGTASFTQSTLDEPCLPKEGGLDSGTKALAPGAGPQQFEFQIQNSDPIFFFNFADGSTENCKAGFVGTINASTQQAAQFVTNAQNFNTQDSETHIASTPLVTSPHSISISTGTPEPIKTTEDSSPSSLATTDTINHSGHPLTPLSAETSATSSATSPPTPSLFSSLIPNGTQSGQPSSQVSLEAPSVLPTATTSGPYHPTSGVPHAIIAVVGALAAMIGFGLAVLAFYVYRKKQRPKRYSFSSFGNSLGENNSLNRSVGSFPETISRPRDFFQTWRPWQRLEDREETRISPFTSTIPTSNLTASSQVMQSSTNSRPVSDATTLFARDLSESDHTYASMSVYAPSSSIKG